jgi:hypothetical protein
MIDSFTRAHDYLSNFYGCPVFYNGLLFRSAEAAYQAQKTADEKLRVRFTYLRSGIAKRDGRRLILRADWEDVKIQIMSEVVHAKFAQNKDICNKLVETGVEHLVENNTWGDCFWGVCRDVGQNWLGRLLMAERVYWRLLIHAAA